MAVAHELKRLKPGAEIIYIGQRGDALSDVPRRDPNIDEVYQVSAGKFRRYHGEGLKQLLDLPTMYKNIRDGFRVIAGILQSYRLLKRLRPDVVFTRGGFVSVPVALGAKLCKIPYITHDSDAIPSLANRLIARWATTHAVALPKEVYAYPQAKTVTVGVPISHQYTLVSDKAMQVFRKELGIEQYQKVLLVTGGGNGAKRLNEAVVECAAHLLSRYEDLVILHIAGRALEADLRQLYKTALEPAQLERVKVYGFVHDMYRYSGAADVTITRAGGTVLAEFAAQGKACILVPNPQLTGGHQSKNAKVLVERHAVMLVEDAKVTADSLALMPPLTDLFDHAEKRKAMGQEFHKLAQSDAAEQLAVVLLGIGNAKQT